MAVHSTGYGPASSRCVQFLHPVDTIRAPVIEVTPIRSRRSRICFDQTSRGGDAMSRDVSELASELQRQGTMICLPVRSELALERFGFRTGQQVMIRFARER